MFVTVVACIVATYMGLMQPTKPGRLQSAVINRSVVAGVLLVVAYIGMTWEERKTREAVATTLRLITADCKRPGLVGCINPM